MSKKSSKHRKGGVREVPKPVKGIQINQCKMPGCKYFGRPYKDLPPRKYGQGKAPYYKCGGSKTSPTLECNGCGDHPPVKSNLAVIEELERNEQYLKADPYDPTKHKSGCPNKKIKLKDDPSAFYKHGKTPTGSGNRYQCKLCKQTFTDSSPVSHHRVGHLNKLIFKLLVNKVPSRRICEIAEIDPKTLYRKIDFIHKQCLAYAGHKEQRLLGIKKDRLYVCVDRQTHVVNWTDRDERLNTNFHVLASADVKSGFVFGARLNYDPELNARDVEHEAAATGENAKVPAMRKYARVWLQADVQQAIKNAKQRKKKDEDEEEDLDAPPVKGGKRVKTWQGAPTKVRKRMNPILLEIQDHYKKTGQRIDIESSEEMDNLVTLPSKGMQVHSEYMEYGHFFFLKKLFSNTEKVRFFLDKESSLRAACLTAFSEEIIEGRCEAFFVKLSKDLTIDEKRVLAMSTANKLRRYLKRYPKISKQEARLRLIKREMKKMKTLGQWKEEWLSYPFPSMNEPEKEISYQTNIGTYNGSKEGEDHLGWLFLMATMAPVDRFFMQARRRVSLLERSLKTASSSARMWHGYNAYNPEMVQKLFDIFRVYYNFIKTEEGRPYRKPKSPEASFNLAARRKRLAIRLPEPEVVDVPTGEDYLDPDAMPLNPEVTGKVVPIKNLTTPAMRIGITRAPGRYEDILYFK